MTEAKLVRVISTATKYVNKSFLSRLGNFFHHFSLRVEGWLWTGWVMSFGGFDCFLLFVVFGGRNKLVSPLVILVQFLCGFGYTFLNITQIILNHLLTHNRPLKMRSQVGNLLL
jgi:hypothetical protein